MDTRLHFRNICAALLAILSLNAHSATRALDPTEFGIVTLRGSVACAAIAKPGLAGGTPVTVILHGKAQNVIPAVIEREATTECKAFEKADVPKPYYVVRRVKPSTAPFDIGIVVVRPHSTFRMAGAKLVASVNGKDVAYTFRECTSREGLHLFANEVVRRQVKPLWHGYYYFGYDAVPNCNDADGKAIKTLAAR